MANVATIPQKRKAWDAVRKGVCDTPIRVLIYGAEKVGKSTFASGAPSPIFVGADSGTERLDIARIEPTSWEEARSYLRDIAQDKHDYKTLVIDPINWFEPMLWDALCKTDGSTNIETYGEGFGKGYKVAVGWWREFLFDLEKCWKRGMHVVITAHAQVKNFKSPDTDSYDRYELAMNEKGAAPIKQWVDAIVFARVETFTKTEKATKKAKGYSTDRHILLTQPNAAYDAGSRWQLPDELELSWQDFFDAVQGDKKRAEELYAEVGDLLKSLGDEAVTKKLTPYVETNRNDSGRLVEVVAKLQAKLKEKQPNEEKNEKEKVQS